MLVISWFKVSMGLQVVTVIWLVSIYQLSLTDTNIKILLIWPFPKELNYICF